MAHHPLFSLALLGTTFTHLSRILQMYFEVNQNIGSDTLLLCRRCEATSFCVLSPFSRAANGVANVLADRSPNCRTKFYRVNGVYIISSGSERILFI